MATLGRRKRTWRTLAAFPLGILLGWIAAGYAVPADRITPEPAVAPAAPSAPATSEQSRNHRVGDEEPAAGEAEVGRGAFEEPEPDEVIDR